MNGQQVGYIRVSAADQHADRQLEGVTPDKVFEDRLTGSGRERPQTGAVGMSGLSARGRHAACPQHRSVGPEPAAPPAACGGSDRERRIRRLP